MAYFVLAGGYAGVAHNFGHVRGGSSIDARDSVVDYVIKIDNLPEDFTKSRITKDRREYYCNKCERVVSEGEMEGKFGCFGHDIETKNIREQVWDEGVFEAYSVKNQKWMTPAFRIWVNNPGGVDKWQSILRYVEKVIPPNKTIPKPIPVGNIHQWMVDEETIDQQACITLPKIEESEVKKQNR